MPKIKDITGQRFGRLVAIKFLHRDSVKCRIYWLFKCNCGNEKVLDQDSAISGNTRSCGCLAKKLRRTHGMTKTKLYSIWHGMKRRCDPKGKDHEVYRKKKIRVCRQWEDSFEKFRDWALANGYEDGLTIDRMDSSKKYAPFNCRWITAEENSRRHSNAHFYLVNGKSLTIPQISKKYNITERILYSRLHQGMSINEAIETPLTQVARITYNGKTKTIREWSEELEIPCTALYGRINKLGWNIDKAFTTEYIRR